MPDYINQMNSYQCLWLWATLVGAAPAGGDNELTLLRKIAERYQIGA